MADNRKIETVLSSAHHHQLIKPHYEEVECYSDYLNTANRLLSLLQVAGENGMNTSQITHRMGFHHNTCKLYLKQLKDLGYVEMEYEGGSKQAVWYLKGKRKHEST